MVKTALFAAYEAASDISDDGKHNDSEKYIKKKKRNVTACSRGDLSQPSSIQGSRRLSGGESMDFTFFTRQSTVKRVTKQTQIGFGLIPTLGLAGLHILASLWCNNSA